MNVSKPNDFGVLEPGHHETVASLGRAYASIEFALCEDGLFRFSTHLQYSYGGFSRPISINDEGYPTIAAARTTALDELLKRWHTPFPSEPQSVHDELRIMREQIESQLCQPSLF